jgi:hypothetical protein
MDPNRCEPVTLIAMLKNSTVEAVGLSAGVEVLELWAEEHASLLLGGQRAVVHCNKLRELSFHGLSGCDGCSGDFSFLRHLHTSGQLTSLDLSHLALYHIPGELRYATALRRLDLSGNSNLGSLGPEEFAPLSALTNLTSLDLAYCEIEEVPLSLLSLKCLQHLSLANNGISELGIVSHMAGLTWLNVGGCHELDMCNPHLPTCQIINLSSTDFPAYILPSNSEAFLPALKAVQLVGWQCSVGMPFETLPSLEEIYIEVEGDEDDETILPTAAFFISCAGISALRKVAITHPGCSGLENFKEFMDGVVDFVRARPDVEFDFSEEMGNMSTMLFR